MRVLLLTHARGPQRLALVAHRQAFLRLKRKSWDCIEANAAFRIDWQALEAANPDLIILHTSFLSLRWGSDWPPEFQKAVELIRATKARAVMIPQDEFLRAASLVRLINEAKIDTVLSCAEPTDQTVLYRGAKTRLDTVLTGYVDQALLRRAKRYFQPFETREFDISYRAWAPEPWLGEKAVLKATIGHEGQKCAQTLGLKTCISSKASDVAHGKDWLKLLACSRLTLGVEGGASYADSNGAARKAHEAGLPIEFLPENAIDLFCLSPRHLEACATRTLQILVEGRYNGVLEAHKHYVPVKPDLSNLRDAIRFGLEPNNAAPIIEAAYQKVSQDENLRYETFAAHYAELWSEDLTRKPQSFASQKAWIALKLKSLENTTKALIEEGF